MKLLAAAIAAAGLCGAVNVCAAYPDRPVRFILAWPPGGTTDVLTRMLAQELSKRWGQTVVVDNRAGANGIVGTEVAARAPPDGYTLLMATADTHAINPGLYAKLPYSPTRDFDPVTLAAITPLFLVVHPSVPADSVASLVKLAKSKPGALNYGSWGNGSTGHLAMESFKYASGINLIHVPYKGVAPAITDLLGGQLQIIFSGPASSIPHVKAGKLMMMGAGSPRRLSAFPDYPTIAEQGFPGFSAGTWYGIVVPAGTPKIITAKLNKDLVDVIRQPDIRARITEALASEPGGNSPAEFAAFIADELKRWSEVARRASVKLDS